MMVRRYFGRYVLATSLLSMLWLVVPVAQAQSAESFTDEVEALLEGVTVEWQGEIVPDIEPLDPQIFTEISPLIDSPDAVKLPEDQQTAD